MPLPAGARFGPYEVIAAAGSGGMGEVYKARDTRLDRTVALKISKEAFGERFRDEALAVAALNHPHISTLHDVGPDYLVMEFVEGRPVHGPLPVAEAVRLAGQIADALAHAHAHGIVHRDLKPSNILVTRAGVKVLDFGLAKRRQPAPPEESQPTLTEDGVVVGTPRYMAPEQIEGKPADERTDIFALGLVLYQMLTGEHPFEQKSAAGTMAAILERDPAPVVTLRPDAPPELEAVVMTCLAKDPEERWQSARELKHALGWAARSKAGAIRHRAGGWIAAAVAVAIALALAVALARRRPETPRPVSFVVVPPDGLAMPTDELPAVSPDGERIAFVATEGRDDFHLYVRQLRSAEVTRVPGTAGAGLPFWSPDGREIGFSSERRIRKTSVSGGPVEVVCDVPMSNWPWATWGRDGTILFSDWSGQLLRVPASGGEAKLAATLAAGERGRLCPQFLPDGRRYLYWSLAARPEDGGIYVASLDSEARTRILDAAPQAIYSPSGHLLFVKGEALMAQAFDAGSLRLSGEPFRLAEPAGAFGASSNGVVAFQTASAPDRTALTWFDRSGRRLSTLGEPANYSNPALSADGRTVAVDRRDPRTKTRDIWLVDAASAAERRLTFDPADDFNPAWSPDGRRIAFTSDRGGLRELYLKLADGSGDDQRLLSPGTGPAHVIDWRADGAFLTYNYWPGGDPMDLYLLPLVDGKPGQPIPFLTSEPEEDRGRYHPGGRFIAYNSTETGSPEIYVQGVSAEGVKWHGKWQVSTGGGLEPYWRGDGRELFYVSPGPGNLLMSVEVRASGATFEAAPPRPLFKLPLSRETRRNRYVATPDGERFLVLAGPDQASDRPLRVLVNWPSLDPGAGTGSKAR